MTSAIRRFVTTVAACGTLGCLNEGPTGGATTGLYTLTSVNDAPLPYLVSGSGANKTEIVSGSVDVRVAGDYLRLRETRVTTNGQATTQTTTENGSWSFSFSNTLALRPVGAAVEYYVQVQNGQLIIVDNGLHQVYSK